MSSQVALAEHLRERSILSVLYKKIFPDKKVQFWQQNNKPIELWSPSVIQQKLDYIHHNPVEVGIVEYPEQYLYSSARNFAGEKELLELEAF
jgi:REP element-mobilizing transposase RayT